MRAAAGAAAVARLFVGARASNAARHAARGPLALARHRARCWWVARVLRLFPWPGDRGRRR